MTTVRIESEELEALLAENRRLNQRVNELLVSNNQLLESRRAADRRAAVALFHRTAGIPVLETPTVPADERVRLRLRLIAEEFLELLDATFDDTNDNAGLENLHDQVADVVEGWWVRPSLPDVADALADLDYVIEGARLEFGIDGVPVFAEVQRANMAKFLNGGPAASQIRPDGKILKPVGWEPPDIVKVLMDQGWR